MMMDVSMSSVVVLVVNVVVLRLFFLVLLFVIDMVMHFSVRFIVRMVVNIIMHFMLACTVFVTDRILNMRCLSLMSVILEGVCVMISMYRMVDISRGVLLVVCFGVFSNVFFVVNLVNMVHNFFVMINLYMNRCIFMLH